MEDLKDEDGIDLNAYIPIIGKHLDAWKDVKDTSHAVIFRLSGMSNITGLIKAKDKSIQPRYIIFRKFNNDLCDSKIESLVFETLSQEGLGPKCYYQNDEYRLEESYDSRPISIFELRNPIFMNQIIEKTFKLNYNKELKSKLLEAKDGKFPTQLEILCEKWLPTLFEKYQSLYDKLTVDEYKESLELVKENWLNEDIYDRIAGLTFNMQNNQDDLVVSHNDIQECNILSMRQHAVELAIIDFEYTSLGNREYDVANIFCELMTDNSYPFYPFIEIYVENALTQEEYEKYSRYYLELYHKEIYQGDLSQSDYIDQTLPNFLQNLYCGMILDGYYWGIWSILMIDESKINDKIFNFAYAKKRLQQMNFLLEHDYIKEAVESRLKTYKDAQDK